MSEQRPARRSGGRAKAHDRERLTVAVTGPTGDIGRSLLRALEHSPRVARVLGMARRPFDPAAHGLSKVSYRRGDVLDPAAMAQLLADADVLVHLAFIIMGGPRQTRAVNLEGSRNVFRAAAAAQLKRLVYASSVAAYGFHADNPQPLSENVRARGSQEHYYSAQKAEVESLLDAELSGSGVDVYVFRPCIVAGPDAPLLLENLPYMQIGKRLPRHAVRLLGALPLIKPVLPDPGVELQLVHHDDVAAAMLTAVLGGGPPGLYNLAAPGELTIGQIATELGWHSLPVPRLAVATLADTLAPLRFLPPQIQWLQTLRTPMIMDTARARVQLHWQPQHDSLSTLREMIAARGA